jgi:uncharacterized protein DUF1207
LLLGDLLQGRCSVEIRLIDLIREVQDAAEDDRESVATLDHLLNSFEAPPRARGRRSPPHPALRRRSSLLVFLALLFLAGSARVSRGDEAQPAPATSCPASPAAPSIAPAAVAAETPVSANEEATGYTFLPTRSIFDPLIADNRWPRFSAEYQAYHKDPRFGNVGAANFGGTLPLLQGPLAGEGRFEVGVQAGVFSIFNLEAASHDLVNADYFFSIPVSARWGWFSAMFRVYHQSSHLGDEFLLDTPIKRINLSYEAVDLIPSFDLWSWGRLYFGPGYLFDTDPTGLKRWYVQAGSELKSPLAFFGWLRPVAALDTKFSQENDYHADWSARAGFQFENEKIFKSRKLLLLAEYYKGQSPNGQFFDRRIEFWGVGLHFFF